MRVLVATTYCDICRNEHDKQTVADEDASIRFVTPTGAPKRLDLCAAHADPKWSEIRAYAIDDDLDKPNGYRANSPNTLTCPFCGKLAARTKQGMSAHTSRMHADIPLGERQAAIGFRVTDKNAIRSAKARANIPPLPAGGLTCPECGRAYKNAAGLSAHLTHAHEMDETARTKAVTRVLGRPPVKSGA